MPLPVFTAIHVGISLVGIVSGFIVVFGMIAAMRLNLLTQLFLWTTVATSVTGFFFPFHGVTPGIVVGALSMIVLLGAIIARYGAHLAGRSRWVYVVCSVIALYFNVFVLIVQSFQKVPGLKQLAPTGSEPPFLVVQGLALVLLLVLGVLAVKRFRTEVSGPDLRTEVIG
jgi:hypothetical protein